MHHVRFRFLRVAMPAIAMAATPMLASAGTYLGTGGGAIPDNQPGNPLVITFNVTETDPVASVDVTLTGLTHSWVGDIIATLEGPGPGPTADIMRRMGATTSSGVGDSSNFAGNYRFIDGGADPVAFVTATANGTGVALPSGDYRATTLGVVPTVGNTVSLNTIFGGSIPTGTWTLRLTDNAAADTGSLTSATLNIVSVPEPTTVAALGVAGLGLLARRRRA